MGIFQALCFLFGIACVAYGYSLDNCGYHKRQWYKSMHWCSHKTSKLFTGDFNGDGQTDMLCHDEVGNVWISLADGDGGFKKSDFHKRHFFCHNHGTTLGENQLFIGDFNGDGRSDLLCHSSTHGQKWISLADKHGRFNGIQWKNDKFKWCYHKSAELLVGDFNGDRKDDIMCHDKKTGYIWEAYTHGRVGFLRSDYHGLRWCYHAGSKFYVGDFDGDGKTDIMCSDHLGRKWIFHSNGRRGFTRGWHKPLNWCHENKNVFMRIADVNGDKKDDIICHTTKGNTWVAYALPTIGFSREHSNYKPGWCGKGKEGFFVGKFNKDDEYDILCHDERYGQKWILYSECPFVKK